MMTVEEISKALQDKRWKYISERVDISWPTFDRLRRGDSAVNYQSVKKMSDYLEGNDEG